MIMARITCSLDVKKLYNCSWGLALTTPTRGLSWHVSLLQQRLHLGTGRHGGLGGDVIILVDDWSFDSP